MNLDHLYLRVPPGDRKEVETLRARWDPDHLCWYLEPGDDRTRFSKWLPREYSREDEEFSITSEQAFVASTTIPCQKCASAIEVVCVFCESGTVDDKPLAQFTVSNMSAVDAALAAKLAASEFPRERQRAGQRLRQSLSPLRRVAGGSLSALGAGRPILQHFPHRVSAARAARRANSAERTRAMRSERNSGLVVRHLAAAA
jgi:Domain of unknown function (DUF5710)